MGKIKVMRIRIPYSYDSLLNSWKCPIKYQCATYDSVAAILKVSKSKPEKLIYEILLCKLLQNPEICQDLLDTAFSEIEDNEDSPGKTLMLIREQIRSIR